MNVGGANGRRRRWLRGAVIALLLLCAVTYALYSLARSRDHQVFGRFVPRVDTSERVVALTFDDGPSGAYTDSVLALLRERNVRATFFVTGAETSEHPELASRIVSSGHELGNHTWSHPRMVLKSTARIRQEVERTDSVIRAAGHEGEIYFRPPYGMRLFGLPWYLHQTGRTTVLWDVEPESFPEVAADADSIAEHVFRNVRPGSIVLLHLMYPSRATSRSALPTIIDGLRAEGYSFVTVSQLLGVASR